MSPPPQPIIDFITKFDRTKSQVICLEAIPGQISLIWSWSAKPSGNPPKPPNGEQATSVSNRFNGTGKRGRPSTTAEEPVAAKKMAKNQGIPAQSPDLSEPPVKTPNPDPERSPSRFWDVAVNHEGAPAAVEYNEGPLGTDVYQDMAHYSENSAQSSSSSQNLSPLLYSYYEPVPRCLCGNPACTLASQ